MTEENTDRVFHQKASFQHWKGHVSLDYYTDIQNKVVAPILVQYMPAIAAKDNKMAVMKIPLELFTQLTKLNSEIHGVPLEILINIAHALKEKEGQSVLVKEKKLLTEITENTTIDCIPNFKT